MLYTVAVSFDQFFDNINLPGDHRYEANTRRDDIVNKLKDHFTILEAYATGSIPRLTALKGGADVDVVILLHYGKHLHDKKPSQVLHDVRNALATYRTNVRRNGQAVTLHYQTWPNVDIVPAAQIEGEEGAIDIPDINREVWVRSKPEIHSEDIDDRSSVCGPNFRKVIKMAKHWSIQHGDYLQSYHIEVMALSIFKDTLSDITSDVSSFFREAATLAAMPLWHNGAYADGYLSSTNRAEVVMRLTTASELSRQAWHHTFGGRSEHKTAIELWKRLFGSEFPSYG